MRKMGLIVGLVVFGTMLAVTTQAHAQHRKVRALLKGTAPIWSGADAQGMSMTNYTNRISPRATLRMGLHNPFSPQPMYSYSNPGVLAQRTHIWNGNEAMNHSWAGNYNNWRWRQPTALVVPPTASYQTSYGWGVGQVRSTPIHHQFGTGDGGGMMGGGGMNTPYLPSSTDQFGLYPVRAPW